MAEVPIGTEIPVILQELQHRHSHDSSAQDSEKTAATPTLYAEDKSIANATEEREESVADSRRSTDMKAPYEASIREKQEEVLARIETTTSNGEIEYPTGLKLTFITIALCLSVLCMALDNTIIATAIPKITDEFQALGDVGWYASAYLLTTCAFQLFFGKLYSFHSVKWVYLIAIAIFELGSLICGVAPNSTTLIVGRAVAGLGSAGIFSGAILIVAHTVSLEKRPMYTGLVGAMYGIASVAGPLMGGAFTDRLTWRWCFYINLPFGAVTAIFIIFFFTSPTKDRKRKFTLKEQLDVLDLEGTAVFLPGVICLLLALVWGGSKYPWNDGRIIALFVVSGVLLLGFVAIQKWKGDKGTVPPRVLLNRNVAACAWYSACLGGSFFILIYYIPIWFQAIKGASAVSSGIMNLPMVLSLVVISLVAGVLVSVTGYYTPFLYLGVVFLAIGAGLLTTFTVDTDSSKWIGYQILFGAGVGFGMQQTLIAVQAVLPPKDIPTGTAIIMFSQAFGGSLFVCVGQNIFSNQLSKHLAENVPDVNPMMILSTGATELQSSIPARYLNQVLVSYNQALVETWYVALAIGCLAAVGAAFVQWKNIKGKKIEHGGVA